MIDALSDEIEEIGRLGTRLYARRQNGVVIPYVEKHGAEWAPEQNWCHANVSRWVAENPGCKAVHGWLVFDLFLWARFSAHSVAEEPDGTLIDITPSHASRRYPFLPHEGDANAFVRLIDELRIQDLDYETGTGAVIIRTVSPAAPPSEAA
jgi:hypothetical protein